MKESSRMVETALRLVRFALGKSDSVQRCLPQSAPAPTSEYDARIEKELDVYRNCVNVHDLPKIALYWQTQHLLPKFQRFGMTHPGDLFEIELGDKCRSSSQTQHVVSIGAGNCDLEVRVANTLKQQGLTNFVIECLEINPDMLRRGMDLAREHDVTDFIQPCQGDFNEWRRSGITTS